MAYIQPAEVELEKNVPIPGHRYSASPYRKALSEMEIGDSFVAPRTVSQSVRDAARYTGRQVTVRKINDAQVRIWRIK